MTTIHEMPEVPERDLRLLAYVLGELDADGRHEVEAMLETDESARAEVAALTATAAALRGAFAVEDGPGLDARRRAAILASSRPSVLFSFVRLGAGLGLAAAACLALALAWPGLDRMMPSSESAAGARGDLKVAMDAREKTAPSETTSRDRPDMEVAPAAAPAAPPAPASESERARARRAPGAPSAGLGLGGGGGGLGGGRGGPAGAAGGELGMTDADVHAYGGRLEGGTSSLWFSAEDPRTQDASADLAAPRDREAYAHVEEHGFVRPEDAPRSTFAVDVDTASYANVRRLLRDGVRPPAGAVRIEELVNAFPTGDAPPSGDDAFAVHAGVTVAPWAPTHRLVRVALKGREVAADMRPATNLVFLIDVSGSMRQPEKLPLVQQSLELLVRALLPDDRVAIVVYAGASGLVLPPTYAHDTPTILDAIRNLQAGGSTNGGAGIELAYATAEKAYIDGGANRVILCTDGDFNVGTSSESELVSLIERKRQGGVFLTVLGFGRGDWQDDRMEALSNAGNGNFAYIDTIEEARRSLVENLAGTLVTIAKDVKIQVEFNPAKVAAYRLLGYENRALAAADFADDAKDGGEIGAGHCVNAFYEVIPVGEPVPGPPAEPRAFGGAGAPDPSDDLAAVGVRWKTPDGEASTLRSMRVPDEVVEFAACDDDLRFGAAVAAFGMLLRSSEHAGGASWAMVREIVDGTLGDDPNGRRAELLELVERAKAIWGD